MAVEREREAEMAERERESESERVISGLGRELIERESSKQLRPGT